MVHVFESLLNGYIFFSFIEPALFSASYVDNIIASVILDTTNITLLWVGGAELGRMEKDVFC